MSGKEDGKKGERGALERGHGGDDAGQVIEMEALGSL